ncbi:hypothetical protein JVU11DRAFT_2973 [Chiua virens]|nr:hypothetical protein JVU11DRAFT_2973 [Chiua virens]
MSLSRTGSQGGETASAGPQFKRLRGFKLHGKSYGGKPNVPTRNHHKIQSDISGTLHIVKKNYHVPTTAGQGEDVLPSCSGQPNTLFTSDTDHPLCIDHFPDGVDLSTLDNVPRQRTASVSIYFAFAHILC